MENTRELLTEHLQILGFAFIVLLFISQIAYVCGFFRFPTKESSEPPPLEIGNVVGLFSVFFVIELIIVPLLTLLWFYFFEGRVIMGLGNLNSTEQGWMNFFAIILLALASWLYCLFLKPGTRQVIWGGDAFKYKRDFFFGCLTWLISYPFVLVIGQLLAIFRLFIFPGPHIDQLAVEHLRNIQETPLLFWMMTFSIVCIVPIVEELLFRGFLQTWLKRIVNRKMAIVLSSLIFAIFHFSPSQGDQNFELIVSLFTLACFLGFLYERQRSLWASIGLHATFNTISIIGIMIE